MQKVLDTWDEEVLEAFHWKFEDDLIHPTTHVYQVASPDGKLRLSKDGIMLAHEVCLSHGQHQEADSWQTALDSTCV